MSVPPSDDDPRDEDGTSVPAEPADPDRAAILARRQRFIALALTGLATTGCEKPSNDSKKPTGVEQSDDGGKACLKVAAPNPDVGTPQPCLEVAEPPRDDDGNDDATPQPCLNVVADPPPDDGNDDAAPRPCLNIAPPPGEPPGDGGDDAAPRPCLRVAQPPDPKPQPCLRVAPPPEPEPEPAKPRPCLKIAEPRPDK